MNMKCSRVFKKALPLALLSATFAMVACDFGSDSKDSSDEQTVEQKNTVEEGSDQLTNTETVDGKNVSEQGSSSSVRSTDESSSSVQSTDGSSSSVQSSTPSASEEGHCFDIWHGADGIARIATGYDAGSENSGYWYTYNDNEDGGKSTIKWAAEPDEDFGGLEPVLEACGNGVCGTFELVKGNLSYDPYVGIGFDIAGKDKNNRVIQADISDMGGLVITYSSTVPAILELSLGDEEDAKIGYALPAYELAKSAIGKTVRIPWSKFAQPSWVKGDQQISMNEAVKKVASVNVRFQAKDGTKGEFDIMGIEAYNSPNFNACPDYVPSDPIPPKSSSSETVIPKSSSSYTGIVVEASAIKCDGFSWFGVDDEPRIDTECDAGGNTSGIWFSYTDSTDRGESVLNWVVRNQFSDHDPEFEDCYGVCGKYTLNKGSLYYDPYVGVGFNLGGTDNEGNLVPVDATSMKQVCIEFSSTHAATLEMGLTDELEERVGYGVPAYDLGKSTTGKSVCIPWSKFAQPAWVKSSQTISTEEAVKSLVSFRFRIQAKDGSEGEFNIRSVNPYGLAAGGAN